MADPLIRNLWRFWSRLSVRQRGTVIIGIPVISLLIALATSIVLQREIATAQNPINHAEQILEETNLLTKTIIDAETGVRGYDLTQEPAYLEPYQAAVSELPGSFGRLNQLVKDGQQRQRLQSIQSLSRQQMQVLQNNLDAVAEQDPGLISPAISPLLSQGKAVMDQLRRQTNTFIAAEKQLLAARQQRLARQKALTLIVLFSAAGIGIIAALFAKYLFDSLDQELTEQQAQLKESKTRLQAIVDNVVDGIITFNREGIIESMNPAAQAIFSYPAPQAVGRSLRSLLAYSAGDTQDLMGHLLSPYSQGPTQELTGRRCTGDTFPVEIAIREMQLNQEHLFTAVLRDLTQQKQTEEQLRLQAEEQAYTSRALARTARTLRKRNQELDQFAYVVSHDLKAPLRAIANLSEWLEEDLSEKLTPDTQRQMELLRGRVHRMEALITGLLQYSRVGRIEEEQQIVDVAVLLQEVVDSLAPGPGFMIEIDPGMPTLETERLLLQQVFANLINNGIKHHDRQPEDPPGQIRISVQKQAEFYQFAVADDGPGIAPQYHEKVFVIFQTLEARDKTESTGIGLSLVRKIVESQGGKIWINSHEGQGTCFYFQWPLQPQVQRPHPYGSKNDQPATRR